MKADRSWPSFVAVHQACASWMTGPVLVSAPPPASVAKSMEDPSVRRARADDEKRRKLMQGQQSTQATGATGLGGGANLALGAKQVLGA